MVEELRAAGIIMTVPRDSPQDPADPRVYALQGELGGPIKVGYSRTPQGVVSRKRDIQLGNPYPLRIVNVLHGGRELEAALHLSLASWRMAGEWFYPSEEVLGLLGMDSDCVAPRPGQRHVGHVQERNGRWYVRARRPDRSMITKKAGEESHMTRSEAEAWKDGFLAGLTHASPITGEWPR